MQVPVHVRNDQNIRAVAIFMADTDLFVTADNVRAAMAEVLEREGEFLVVDRGGDGNNCDEYPLDVTVTLAE